MRFDNKDFESNVQTSLSTLDRLKQALNFSGAAKGLDSISDAAGKVDVGGIGSAVETVQAKFSAFEAVAISVLSNIANQAVNAGAQMVKSLTIDQVTAGFDKYAEKTTAVQTIMAATKNQFSDEAEQMSYVNEQLEKLNWFTDETSYNLVDMVSNIGKFTNSGVKLDEAVTSMQGIATWAAISGSNATEASRAMYNLSQALGAGYVRLIDWKSIENANMATMEFKEAAIQAGLEMGTLVEYTDELTGELQIMSTVGEANNVTAQNFADSLTKGAWLTSDVLNKVLNKYGDFTNALNSAYNETGLETFQLLEYTEDYEKGLLDLNEVMEETGVDAGRLKEIFEELSSPTNELGRRAFKAAQETKTFAEVIAYTKDAVSSGWMNTFEIIFGDYQEAKAMWSDLAEVFYEIFVVSGEARNEMLEAWKELGGRTSMLEAISNAYGAVVKVIDTVKEAFRDIFPARDSAEKGQSLFNLTERIREFTARLILTDDAAQKLKSAVTPLFQLLKSGLDTVRGVGTEMKDVLFPAFKSIIDSTKNITGPLGRVLVTFKDLIKFGLEPLSMIPRNIWSGFTSGLPAVIAGFDDISKKVAIWLTNFNETLLTSEKLHKALSVISSIMSDIGLGVLKFFNLAEIIQSFKKDGGGISGVLSVIERQLRVLWSTVGLIIERLTGINISEGIIGKIADGISSAIDKIKGAFESFKGVDTSGVDKVRDDTEKKLGPVASLFEGFKKVLSGVWNFLKMLGPVFSTIASALGSALGKIGEGISSVMSNIDAGDVLDLANGGILVAIGLGIKKLIDWINELKEGEGLFSGIIGNIKGVISSITGVLDSARGALEAWQQNLKASTLIKLAAAIGVITLSVIALSEVDPDKLSSALTAITIEFGELMGSLEAFSKITAGLDKKGITSAAFVLIEMSVAVLILTSAVKSLASLEWDDMIKGLAGVGVLCFELSKTLENLDLDGLSIAKGIGLILLATSIRILASSVKSLSELRWGEMIEGLAGVGVLCFELSQTLSKTDFNGLSISKSIGILILAASIKIMASAVKQMTELKWGEMLQGLAGVGTILLELSLFLNNTNLDGMGVAKGIGLLLFAASLKVMASAVKQMTELDFGEMIKGLVGMAGVLLEVVGFMKLLEMTQTSGGQLIAISAGLIILGTALEIIADVMQKFGGMGWEEIGKSLVELGGSMIIIALGMAAMQNALPGAAALLVVAAALGILSPVMQSFGDMEWEQIIKSLVELAGIFTILGVAGAILGPLTPVILALSAAIAILGAGVLALGGGIALLGAGLATVAVAGVGAVEVLVFTIAELIKMIPDFIAAIGEGLIGIIIIIGDSATEIAYTVVKVGKAILLSLRELIPDLVDTILQILDETLASLVEHGPSIIESVVTLFMMLLGTLTEHLPKIVEFGVQLILDLLAGIAEHVGDFIQAGIDIIINLIDGLGQGLVDNAPRLRDALLGLLKNLLKAVLAFFGIHSPSTVFADIGKNLILGLIKGIGGMVSGAVKAVKDLVKDVIDGIAKKIDEFKQKGKEFVTKIKDGISEKAEELKNKMSETVTAVKDKISDKIEEFKEKGGELITKIKDGITSKIEDAKKAMGDVITAVKKKIDDKIEEFIDIGKDIVNGLKKGIGEAWEGFTTWVGDKFDGLVQGWNDFWGINSPSKLTSEMGTYIVEGLKKGINEQIPSLLNSITNVSEGMKDSFTEGLEGITLSEDMKSILLAVGKDGKSVSSAVGFDLGELLSNGVFEGFDGISLSEDMKGVAVKLGADMKAAITPKFDDINEPVITPVVDLSEVEASSNAIDEMFGSAQVEYTASGGKLSASLDGSDSAANIAEINENVWALTKESRERAQTSSDYATRLLASINANPQLAENQNVIREAAANVTGELSKLRGDISEMQGYISRLKVVMDSGALVGGLIDNIDAALGQRSILAGRGV